MADALNFVQRKYGIGSKVLVDGKWPSVVQGFKPPRTYVVLVNGIHRRTVPAKRLSPYYGSRTYRVHFKLPEDYTGIAGLGQQEAGEAPGAPQPDPWQGRDPATVALLQKTIKVLGSCYFRYLAALEEVGLVIKRADGLHEIIYWENRTPKAHILTQQNILWLTSVPGGWTGKLVNATANEKALKILLANMKRLRTIVVEFLKLNRDPEAEINRTCNDTFPQFQADILNVRFEVMWQVILECEKKLTALVNEIGYDKLSPEIIAKLNEVRKAMERAKASKTITDTQVALDACNTVIQWLMENKEDIIEVGGKEEVLRRMDEMKSFMRSQVDRLGHLTTMKEAMAWTANRTYATKVVRLVTQLVKTHLAAQAFGLDRYDELNDVVFPKFSKLTQEISKYLLGAARVAVIAPPKPVPTVIEPRRRRRTWYEKIGNWMILSFLLMLLASTGPKLLELAKGTGKLLFGGGK